MKSVSLFLTAALVMNLHFGVEAYAAESVCPDLERITLDTGGGSANGDSWSPQLSADGNTLVFISEASDLEPSGGPSRDVFLFDRVSGSISRVPKSTTGGAANVSDWESLRWVSLSSDGNHVAFVSDATNMVAGDTAGTTPDAYVWHRNTDTIEKVNWDTTGGSANNEAKSPSISGDGRYVVFASKATDLVPGDVDDTISDIFLWDGNDKSIRKLSQTAGGTTANGHSAEPVISADGNSVAFATDASNLASVDTRDSGSGSYVLWDAVTGEFELIALNAIDNYAIRSFGLDNLLAISADGGDVAFFNMSYSDSPGWRIYHWDRVANAETLVTQALGPWVDPYGSDSPWFRDSDSVRLSLPPNAVIIPGTFTLTDSSQTITYVMDVDYTLTSDGEFYTVNRLPGGAIAEGGTAQASYHIQKYGPDGDSYEPSISSDGRFVGFASDANNLVEGDGNNCTECSPGERDGFVWDRDTSELEKLTWNTAGGEANYSTDEVSLSTGSGFAAITSGASDLVPADLDDGIQDIFLGRPCMAVPEPSSFFLQAAALSCLVGLATLRRSRPK
jgi:Tol biopolymer transport system component